LLAELPGGASSQLGLRIFSTADIDEAVVAENADGESLGQAERGSSKTPVGTTIQWQLTPPVGNAHIMRNYPSDQFGGERRTGRFLFPPAIA